jgi:hypothetical protein
MPRGAKSECDGYFDLSLANDRTYMSPLAAKLALYASGMHISLLLHYSSRGFVVIMQKRKPVDPARCKCPRYPLKNQRLGQVIASDIHSLRTTEKRSHLTKAQGEDCNLRPVHMPLLVPNSPFRKSATRLRSKYRCLSWHPKPAGTPRKERGCVLQRATGCRVENGAV